MLSNPFASYSKQEKCAPEGSILEGPELGMTKRNVRGLSMTRINQTGRTYIASLC